VNVVKREACNPDREASTTRGLALVFTILLVIVPFGVVDRPLMADLPQHVAQVRLFYDYWRGTAEGPDLEFQPWTPYLLAYLPMALAWPLLGPEGAGRFGAASMAIAWVAGLHWMAWRRGLSSAAATLASLLVFHQALAWGVLAFISGFPCFVVWLEVLQVQSRQHSLLRATLWITLAGCGLWFSHALWFLAGLAAYGTAVLIRPGEWSKALAKIMPLLVLLLVLVGLSRRWVAHGFIAEYHEPYRLLERFHPISFRDSLVGVTWSSLENWVLVAIAVWVGGAAFTVWHRRSAYDRQLFVSASLLFLLYCLLPRYHNHTVLFAQRWLAPAVALVLIALPAPCIYPKVARGYAMVALASMALLVAVHWWQAERSELAGFNEAIAAVDHPVCVVGLDYIHSSQWLLGRPYLQMATWIQIRTGSRTAFSFADLGPQPMVYRVNRQHAIHHDVFWDVRLLEAVHLQEFDVVLLRAEPERHAAIAALWGLVPIAPPADQPSPWRLYRIE
jgi:hypothetical protein